MARPRAPSQLGPKRDGIAPPSPRARVAAHLQPRACARGMRRALAALAEERRRHLLWRRERESGGRGPKRGAERATRGDARARARAPGTRASSVRPLAREPRGALPPGEVDGGRGTTSVRRRRRCAARLGKAWPEAWSTTSIAAWTALAPSACRLTHQSSPAVGRCGASASDEHERGAAARPRTCGSRGRRRARPTPSAAIARASSSKPGLSSAATRAAEHLGARAADHARGDLVAHEIRARAFFWTGSWFLPSAYRPAKRSTASDAAPRRDTLSTRSRGII